MLRVAAGPAGDGAVLEREPAWHPRQGVPLPGLPVRAPTRANRGSVRGWGGDGPGPPQRPSPAAGLSGGGAERRDGPDAPLAAARSGGAGTGSACAVPRQVRGGGGQRRGAAALHGAGAPQAGAPPAALLPDQMGREELPAAAHAALRQRGGVLPLRQVRRGAGCGHGAAPAPLTATPLRSDSGTFLGLGTVTGSVAIHIAFSLQVSGGAGRGRGGRPAP